MTATEPVWKEVTRYRSPEFEDEQALGCYLTKVFCYHTDRNAWWGTPTGEIRGYALSRKPLEDKIQNERTQGTRFNISELPAVAIMGKAHDLVIFEFDGVRIRRSIASSSQFPLFFHGRGRGPNNAFKPTLLRSTNNVAGKACHVVGSATQAAYLSVRPLGGGATCLDSQNTRSSQSPLIL